MKKTGFLFFVLAFLALAQPARAASLETLAAGGTGGWVNTERPLTVDDFKGRVILLDFWTYGCINCMQVIPDLDYLEKKFPQLLVIGVHSAKYKGEGLSDRIKAAAERFGIHHPVMNDNDYKVWEAFDVHAWPTLIVLDETGKEISRYAGEGHRDELERDVAKAVENLSPAMPASLVVAAGDTGVLAFPSHLIFAKGTLWGDVFFVADTAHNRVVAVAPDGAVKGTIGSGNVGAADGDLKTAQFKSPRGMAYVDGVLYVADTGNHNLRAADLKAGTVETVAGNGTRGRPKGGLIDMSHNELASPWDVELMADGKTLAIANAGTHQLYSYDIAKKSTAQLAGNARESIVDGAAAKAELAQPSALSLQGGTLYFVDAETSSLRKLTPEGAVETLVGTGLFDFGLSDGKGKQAQMQHPQGLFATADKVYVADTYNNALRAYDIASGELRTIKLTGETLLEPGDVYVMDGKAYVTDTGHHRIVEVNLADGAAKEIKLTP